MSSMHASTQPLTVQPEDVFQFGLKHFNESSLNRQSLDRSTRRVDKQLELVPGEQQLLWRWRSKLQKLEYFRARQF